MREQKSFIDRGFRFRLIGITMIVISAVILLILCGCTTPGIQCKVDKNQATFAPIEKQSDNPVIAILNMIFPASLPPGNYTVEQTEHGLKASADTKMEMQLIDLNLSKMED